MVLVFPGMRLTLTEIMRNWVALFVFLALVNVLKADKVFLKNGQVLEGRITAQSRASVSIQTDNGTVTLQKAQIRRIVFGAVKKDDDKKKKEQEERLKKLKEEREKREKEREENLEKEKDELERKREEERRKQAAQEVEQPTMIGAVVRSALLPGLGQMYQDRSGVGATYMGSFFVLLATTGGHYAHYSYLKKRYEKQNVRNFLWSPLGFDTLGGGLGLSSSTISQSDFNAIGLHYQLQTISTRKKMEAAAYRANLAATALFAFYAWNIADAAIFSSEAGSLSVLPAEGGLLMAYSYRF